MIFDWGFILTLGIMSAALLIATLVRSRIRFFQRFLIPNSLTAGFLLLPFYNCIAPRIGMDTVHLENMVYHFLCLSFIAMTLRTTDKRQRKGMKDIIATANSLLSQYALQSFLGLLISIALILWVIPDLFPGFGLFTTLGFSLGPGQAFSIGSGWEDLLSAAAANGTEINCRYEGLGDIGLTMGAIGFLWACFGGIFLVNWAVRKGWIDRSKIEQSLNENYVRKGVFSRMDKVSLSGEKDLTNPEAIDPLTLNFAIVIVTYVASFYVMKGLSWLLSFAGDKGAALASNLWGIMFVFCALMAMLVKALLKLFKLEYIVDNNRMNRIAGFSVDFMVAAALGAISVSVVAEYWLPILIMAVLVGLATTGTHIWLSSRMFTDHVFYRTILVYGCATGTLPTGLALLRIIDPNFETPASRDYMYASGFVFAFAIPILLSANGTVSAVIEGNFNKLWFLLGLYGLYILFCLAVYLFLSGKRRFKDPGQIWLKRKK